MAYTSSFYFIGRKDGIERKWMLYESDDESNKIDLLYESPTKERNGVKIVVPVKWSDRVEFINKIKEQLAYFENVYFDCGYEIVNEKVKIVRSEHFQWSSLSRNSEIHICLDNVYYPIDWDKLGMSEVSFPVGLRFSLTDGLSPVPNREQLKYTNETKKAIIKKIEIVADYFVGKYNESIKNTDNVFEIIRYYENDARFVPHFDGSTKINIRNLGNVSTMAFVAPKLNKIKYLDMNRIYHIKDHLIQEYVVKQYLDNGRFYSSTKHSWRNTFYFRHVEEDEIYTFTELNPLKKAYLREILGNKKAKFLKKERKISLGDVKKRYTGRGYDNYVMLLELWKYPKSEWRERIKELQYVISLVTANFKDADKIEVPKEWLEARKKQRLQLMAVKGTNVRTKKLAGEVIGKIAQPLERYVSGKNCKFVPIKIQMEKAHIEKFFTIYGGEGDESLMQQLFTVIDRKKTRILFFSDRELKNLKEVDLHNWMEIGKFMKGKHKMFKRIVTAYLINSLMKEYSSVFYRAGQMADISTPLYDKLVQLKKYTETNFINGDEEIYKAMLTVAEENKLFDTSIYDVYKEVKFIFSKLPFLNPVFATMASYKNEGMLKATKDLFKYYKQRIDWKHYSLPINEELAVEVKEEELVEI